jgi:hypothetical protein
LKAFESRDYESFYALVDFMLEFQNDLCNAYLVAPFLIKVMEKGLDITKLLESNICAYKLEPKAVEHMECFPSFHPDSGLCIVNYKNSFIDLLHDEQAYEQMFGDRYPVPEGMDN